MSEEQRTIWRIPHSLNVVDASFLGFRVLYEKNSRGRFKTKRADPANGFIVYSCSFDGTQFGVITFRQIAENACAVIIAPMGDRPPEAALSALRGLLHLFIEHLETELRGYMEAPLITPSTNTAHEVSEEISNLVADTQPARGASVDEWLDWRDAQAKKTGGRPLSLPKLATMSRWSESTLKKRSAERTRQKNEPSNGSS